MLRQEGDSQVEDRRWYQQDHTWEAEMIPSDIDTRGRDNSTGQWRGETASMVADMGEGGVGSKRAPPGQASFHNRWHSL